MLWEDARGVGLAEALASHRDHPDARVALVVGPEGGLSAEEVDALVARGAVAASLGPTVMRTETAAVVSLALAIGALGGMGGARVSGAEPLGVAFRTLGCKVNRAESESIAAELLGRGATVVDESEARVVIVSTCTVTGEADAKDRKAIRHALGCTRRSDGRRDRLRGRARCRGALGTGRARGGRGRQDPGR